MTNIFRTNNLVTLLLAHQRGEDVEFLWAARIRKYLESNGGHAPLHRGDNWTLCLRPTRKEAPKKGQPRKRR